MAWMADHASGRTYDPDSGQELLFISGGSDGSKSLEIRGEDFCLSFIASLVSDPISAAELDRLGNADAMVWRVYGGSWGPTQRSIVVAALSATKMRNGLTIRGEPYFVRFKPDGELYVTDISFQSALDAVNALKVSPQSRIFAALKRIVGRR